MHEYEGFHQTKVCKHERGLVLMLDISESLLFITTHQIYTYNLSATYFWNIVELFSSLNRLFLTLQVGMIWFGSWMHDLRASVALRAAGLHPSYFSSGQL